MAYLSESKVISDFLSGKLQGKSFTFICRFYAEKRVPRFLVESTIDRLVGNGKLNKRDGLFFLSGAPIDVAKPSTAKKVEGVLRCNERGFGFVAVQGDREYFIPAKNMGQALNGDWVEIVLLGGREGDLAEITKVVERGKTKLVGRLFSEGGLRYVRPDDRAYFSDIFIKDCEIADGVKVLTELIRFPKNRCPEGRILTIIGDGYTLETEEQSLILESGIPTEFSEAVQAELPFIAETIEKSDLRTRADLRDLLIFTIDGDSAKDFDDAVSLTFDGEYYQLGVHIADVSHYIKSGSALDASAYERGTSVYLPDKVVPMLPFVLSDGICSLREGEDRLTVTVWIKFDAFGAPIEKDFTRSVIRSKRRLTYNLVQSMLDGDQKIIDEYADVYPTIKLMDQLRVKITERKRQSGFIDLDVSQSEIDFSDGRLEVRPHKSTPATQIIEQFMISANEAVAEYLFYQDVPCLYRVHEKPSEEKLRALKDFLNLLGVKTGWRRDEVYPKDIQRLLDECKDKRFGAIVNKIVLRSMQKAEYSSKNVGHFGLASKCYCHFTSPIRRYPDLIVHRALCAVLEGDLSFFENGFDQYLLSAGEKTSFAERRAEELERSVDDLYRARFMSEHVGEVYDGVISGVVSGGFFVELENTCEGFVPIELLPAGNYVFDKDSLSLSSKKRRFSFGDKVKICIVSADIASRKVDFCLAESLNGKLKK